MLKLQVVLVPPSAQNGPISYGFTSSTADSSQLLPTGSLFGSVVPRNGDTSLPFPSNLSAANASIYPNHFSQTKRKKFLHFTKSSNSLLDLSIEIVQKCEKMYPTLSDEIEILSLQDSSGCDLDPDFLVKDVFNIDNTVLVILKNELDIDDTSPVAMYRTKKRKKLNNGLAKPQAQTLPQIQSAQSLPPASSSTGSGGGILNIAKKRPSASAIRHPTSGAMRISTPLAHQIYPPPAGNRMVSNNSDDEDAGERSFLPPPAQPQSPPIRISSGMGTAKRIRSAIEEDAVSRSETVDPDKSKQQRLLSGTPLKTTMTPNRVTLTGQRVVSERRYHANNNNVSIFTAGTVSNNRQPSSANTRITSGMLSIPEPRIAEIEKELREGPSSPASILPAVPDRIPMKESYQKMTTHPSDDNFSSSEEQDSDSQVRASALRQTSIADNNGSPVKDSPLGDNNLHNVHLADLPGSRSPSAPAQRKTSLEARVENKSFGALAQNATEVEPVRMVDFSEDEDEDEELENGRENDHETGHTRTAGLQGNQRKPDQDEEEDSEGNDTVLITKNDSEAKSLSNSSFQKTEFLKLMEDDSNELPPWFKPAPGTHLSGSKSKPYTTVLHKDIDNSRPDARNIIPRHTPRTAARKAAEIILGKRDQSSDDEKAYQASSMSTSSSGIETDGSLDDENNRISVNENNSVKTLNLHPLKEKVILSQDMRSNSIDDATSSSSIVRGHDEVKSRNSKSAGETALGMLNGDEKTSGEVETTNEKPPVDRQAEMVNSHDETQLVGKEAEASEGKSSTSEVGVALPRDEKNGSDLINSVAADNQSEKAQNNSKDSVKDPMHSNSKVESKNSPTGDHPKLTRKEELEIKRREREAARAAKLEAAKKLKAEKESQKKAEREAKQRAREEAKKAREADAARKKLERENKKKLKLDKIDEEKRKRDEAPVKSDQQPVAANGNEEDVAAKVDKEKVQSTYQDGGNRLKELKAKFTKSRAYVPAGLVPQKVSRSDNDSTDSSETSDEEESSDDSSSSDSESSSHSKKSRRLIVDTPKGPLTSTSSKSVSKMLPGLEAVPQSTQRSNPSSQATPNKVPVTRMMELSSPVSSNQDGSTRSSFLQGLPQKVRPSLSSLSDLVSRGVPDVREKSLRTTHQTVNKRAASDSDESNDEEESVSDSDSDDSDSDSSSTDGSSFISAKTASTALGKKKKGSGGFASLIKDSRKS